jgi:hypothetical protein
MSCAALRHANVIFISRISIRKIALAVPCFSDVKRDDQDEQPPGDGYECALKTSDQLDLPQNRLVSQVPVCKNMQVE